MKRLVLFMLALMFIGGTAFSQISFVPKAGGILAKYGQNFKDSDEEDYLSFRGGPSVGAVMDMPILDWLSFQPSAMFTVKGTAHNLKKWSEESENYTYEGHIRDRLIYFEIPINVAAKLELGPGTAQVFVGPYIAFGIAGNHYADYTETNDVTSESNPIKKDEKIKFKGNTKDEDWDVDGVHGYLKPFDFGFDFGLGYQWKALLFNFGYNLGLVNIMPKVEDWDDYDPKDVKTTNQGIFFNVAWLFGTE